ncbi:MAG TPA: hypothetical protein ENN19_01150 [Chloroflexi bacterium]|nr:hypothetical protein [Chloroflexota bacterium]
MTLQQILFLILSVITLIAALMVVTLHNISRVVFGLILSFVGVTGLFLLLQAPHLAVLQFLVYVGGVFVLLLLGARHLDEADNGDPADGETERKALALLHVLRRRFAVVLAHDIFGPNDREGNRPRFGIALSAALGAAALGALLVWTILQHDWVTTAPGPVPIDSLTALARTLVAPYAMALPSAVALLLLLIALIGALSITRRR